MNENRPKHHRQVIIEPSVVGRASLGLIRMTGLLTQSFGHKGLYRVSRWLAHHVSRRETFTLRLLPGPTLELPVVAYWLRLAVPSYEYEPELFGLLRSICDVDYQFVDCGANVGYWSAMVTLPELGARRGLAIEAGSQAFELLSSNLTACGGGMTPLRFAIAAHDDRIAELSFRVGEACDAGASIAGMESTGAARTGVERVPTITFDTLVARYLGDGSSPLVVKLDIEGIEEVVITESRVIVERDCLLIAEDHGNDPNCRVSRALHARGFLTAYLDEAGGGFWFTSMDELARVKTHPGKGYNVVALRPESRFRAAVDAALAGPLRGSSRKPV